MRPEVLKQMVEDGLNLLGFNTDTPGMVALLVRMVSR